MVIKTNFLSISVLVSEIVTFMSKKKVLYEFPKKCLKTTERHSLPVCDSLYGEFFFFFFLFPFSGLIKNNCLNKANFSSGFVLLKIGPKNKFLSISELVSEIVTFMSKKKSSLYISSNMLQNNQKA